MPKSDFLILGKNDSADEPTYWNTELGGWITDSDLADTFDRRIRELPLPEGAVGIIEITPETCVWMPVMEINISLLTDQKNGV